MKHTFKKVAAIFLAALMCVSAMMPTFAADVAKCPGQNSTHTAVNCTYVQVSEQKATCKTEGFVTGRCTSCSKVFNVSQTPALGHEWNDIVPATCNAPATRTCKVCNDKITVSPALTHLYTAYTVSGGVCKVGERISRNCIYCGLEDKKIIGSDGHEYALASYVEPSNCVTDGQARYTCVVSGCGASKVIPIKATSTSNAHSYGHWVTVKGANVTDPNAVAATCTTSGRASIVCKYCDDVKVISLGKKTHSLSPEQAKKDATCVEPGFEAYKYCVDCRAYFNLSGAQVKYEDLIVPAHHSNPAMLTVTTEVLPTCSNDGWRYVSCTKCTTYKDQKVTISRYSGHLYYANVTKQEDKINILKALGLYTSDATVETTWKSLAVVDFNKPGQNKVWKNYIPATCTADASVTWICLNCTKNTQGNYVQTVCEVGQTMIPSGNEYLRTNHKFADVYPTSNKLTGTAYVDSPAATCTRSGIRVYNCVNEYYDVSGNLVGCNVSSNAEKPSLGHKWVKVDSITTPTAATSKAATCRENGLQCYKCENVGCTETRTEVLVSTGTEHNWEYIGENVSKMATLKCNETVLVKRYCKETSCPASANPVDYLAKGPDHEFYDVTIPANVEAIKALDMTTNPSIKVGEKAVVVYSAAGNCERGATYKLVCVNGDCVMFKSYEIVEGFAQGHKKTYIGNTSIAATCTSNGGSNQWYCSNKGCAYYVDDTAGTPVLPTTWTGRDTIYAANHYIWNATTKAVNTVTYKNVPDSRISGATSLTAAQAIEAPVSANGVVTRAVAIEGTSLVWVYKYTAKDHTESTVTYGGLYCVDCKSYTGEGATSVPVPLGHSYSFKQSVAATCQNYGYTLYECACGDAYQTNYSKVSTHSYLFLNALNRETAWNNLTAAQKEGRAYLAPTCSMSGYAIDVCTVCNITSTVPLAATGHMNKSREVLTTSCLDRPTDRVCTNVGCGFTIPKNHDYGADNICKVCLMSK